MRQFLVLKKGVHWPPTSVWSWYHCRFWFASTSGLKLNLPFSYCEFPPRRQACEIWDAKLWKLLLCRCPFFPTSLWLCLCPLQTGDVFALLKYSFATLAAPSEMCCKTHNGEGGRLSCCSWTSPSSFNSISLKKTSSSLGPQAPITSVLPPNHNL